MTDGRSGILKLGAERLEGEKRRRTAGVGVSGGRNQKQKGLGRIKGQRTGSQKDPTLTQREFPLLVPQRAFRHHLQVQHWVGSLGRAASLRQRRQDPA